MYEIEIISESENQENQDRAKVIKYPDSILMILADGAGGIAEGTNAAEKAIKFVQEYMIDKNEFLDPNRWTKLIVEFDRMLHHNNSGETTLIIVAVKDGFICGSSVGDSGIWNIVDDDIIDITENQYRKPLIGSGASIPVPFGKYKFDGTLLIATDGLLKYTKKEKIIEANRIENIKEASECMIKSVRLKSGGLWDDTTLILCRNRQLTSRSTGRRDESAAG